MSRHFRTQSQPHLRLIIVLSLLLVGGLTCTTFFAVSAPGASSELLPTGAAQAVQAAPAAVQSAKLAPETRAVPENRKQAAPEPTLVPDYTLPPITNGLVPVLTKIPTQQKVVFLTIDDGATQLPQDLALLQANGIKASLFLAKTFIAGNPEYFSPFVAAGSRVEDHTISHDLKFLAGSYAQQKAEICGMADYALEHYGRRPVFFRPPGGPYSAVTRKAAADCGMKAIIDWEAKANAGGMDYQQGNALRPGEIVLMHFRPEFANDLQAFVTAQKAAGLKVVLLEDYLQVH